VRRRHGLYLAAFVGMSALLHSSCGGMTTPAGPVVVATPTASPTLEPTSVPTSTPRPTVKAKQCGEPLPPPIAKFRAKVHLKAGDYWTLDSTPIVDSREYCAQIGFTDGRRECPVRTEGSPDRKACEVFATGVAEDTGRGGPTWRRDGSLCTGIASGCDNDPDNQFALRVYWQGQGEYTVCAENGVCGSVYARGPA
jgi:hypothetical protein